MGRRRFAGAGVGTRQMAWHSLRVVAGRLRGWVHAGRGSVFPDLSLFRACPSAPRLAVSVLHWRVAGSARALYSRQGQRIRGLASVTHGLDRLLPEDIREFATFCVHGSPDDVYGG